MNAVEVLKHARLDLAVDSITFFRDGARVHRVVPVPQSGEVSLPCGAIWPRAHTSQAIVSVSGFEPRISFSSIRVEPRRGSGIRIREVHLDRRNRLGGGNAVRDTGLHHHSIQCHSISSELSARNGEADRGFYSVWIKLVRDPSAEPSTKSSTGSVAATEQLRLAYTTSSMRWSAFHLLDVHSKTSSAALVTAVRLHNYSSETWNACKISLSSQQSPAAAVSVQPRARARTSFQRSFCQPQGQNAVLSRGEGDDQLGRVSNMRLKHGSRKEAQSVLRYPQSHQQAGRQCSHRLAQPGRICGCLPRKVGLDTEWTVPGRQAFFAGMIPLSRPIDCAEFREVDVHCGFDDVAGAGYVEVRVRSELVVSILPGPMQVNLDGAYVSEVAVPARSPLDLIHFTCETKGV